MKRDYPELEGKVIEYVNPDFPEIKSALVVGVNYDIGITIVNADNVNQYLSCTRGPSSPHWKGCRGTESAKMEAYKEVFACKIKMIKAGKFDPEAVDIILRGVPLGTGVPFVNPSAATCSFAA